MFPGNCGKQHLGPAGLPRNMWISRACFFGNHTIVSCPVLVGSVERKYNSPLKDEVTIKPYFLRLPTCVPSTKRKDAFFRSPFSKVSWIPLHKWRSFCFLLWYSSYAMVLFFGIPLKTVISQTWNCELPNEDMILALAGQFKQLSHEPEKYILHTTFLSYDIPFTGKHQPNKLTCS